MSTLKAPFRRLLELKEAIRRGKSISGLNMLVCVSLVGNTVQSLNRKARDQSVKQNRFGYFNTQLEGRIQFKFITN